MGFRKPEGVKIIDHLKHLEIEDGNRNRRDLWTNCGEEVAGLWEKHKNNVEELWEECVDKKIKIKDTEIGKDTEEVWKLLIAKKCGKDLKNWFKKNKEALDATDFSSFDVTTLHDLLPCLLYTSDAADE